MNKYLLLRDNKESGPYTVAELAERGIKAYDLVWLEGKSAAWRYPSEIDELRPYSPVVEEQPFDRFYRKPQAESTQKEDLPLKQPPALQSTQEQTISSSIDAYKPRPVASNSADKFGSKQNQTARSAEPVKIPASVATGSAKVFVTLPGNPAKDISSSARTQVNDRAGSNSLQQPEYRSQKTNQPVAESDVYPGTTSIRDMAAFNTTDPEINQPAPGRHFAPETNSADLVAEAGSGRQTVNNTSRGQVPESDNTSSRPGLHSRSAQRFGHSNTESVHAANLDLQKRPTKSRLNSRSAVTLLTGLCLLLGGVVIGLIISNSKKEDSRQLDEMVKRIQQKELTSSQEVRPPVPAVMVSNEDQHPAESENAPVVNENSSPDVAITSDKKVVQAPPVKKHVEQVETTPASQEITNSDPVVEPQRSGVRESVTRGQSASMSQPSVKNLRSMIALETSDYKTGVLGGISGLELIVTNNSTVDVDQLVAEIEYLGPEKRVVKTQSIVFNNLKAGQKKIQEVPRTNRGVSVNYSIKTIHARSLDVASTDL